MVWLSITLAVAVAVFAIVRLLDSNHPRFRWNAGSLDIGNLPLREATKEQLMALGQREYAKITEWVPVNDRSRLAGALKTADVLGLEHIDSTKLSLLINAAAEFMYLRYGQDSPMAYADWLLGRGCRWSDLEPLLKVWTVDTAYPLMVGGEFPTDESSEQLFHRYFTPTLDWEKGVNRPASIAAERRGTAIVIGVADMAHPVSPRVAGIMPSELWHGKTSGNMCQWLLPKKSFQDLIREFGAVTCAQVAVVTRFADGSIRPRMTMFTWSPVEKQWTLQQVTDFNYSTGRLSFLGF